MNSLQVPSFDIQPPRNDVSMVSTPQTPGGGQKRKGNIKRPTLYIPPPQTPTSPYSANITMPLTGNITMPITAGTPQNPHMYSRKASEFMFSQFNGIRDFTVSTAKSGMGIGEKCSFWLYNKVSSWSKKWFTHFFLTIVLVIYTVGGALLFVYVEGAHEEKIVRGDERKAIYDLIKDLRLKMEKINVTTEEEFQGDAYRTVEKFSFEIFDIYKNNQLFRNANRGKVWTFWNALVFCGTIYTTMGYGHIYPTTTTGQALTIVYSIIGIPLFLIALTDFGKLFTRCIKFFWSFVRRVYYTGSCRRARKRAHVQEIFKGAQMMYEIATMRRPSQFNLDPEAINNNQNIGQSQSPDVAVGNDTPTTPAPSNFEIDDEFNLPISLAIFILVLYIFLGAVVYCFWEGWGFFSAFYFVFISMSTIGFGDFVPQDPICMMVSIVYLVFGLALMSMCINVVQAKLSDTFREASAKIGATIGLKVDEEDGTIATVPPGTVEMPEVHDSSPKTEEAEQAKPEEQKPAEFETTVAQT